MGLAVGGVCGVCWGMGGVCVGACVWCAWGRVWGRVWGVGAVGERVYRSLRFIIRIPW